MFRTLAAAKFESDLAVHDNKWDFLSEAAYCATSSAILIPLGRCCLVCRHTRAWFVGRSSIRLVHLINQDGSRLLAPTEYAPRFWDSIQVISRVSSTVKLPDVGDIYCPVGVNGLEFFDEE